MIPRLYEHNETSFTSFGIGSLKDTTSCEVTEQKNGTYELVLKYPLTGSLFSEIQKERIIYAQVNDLKSLQAFRIYRITAPISGIITVYAQHISYDLSGVVVFPCTFDGSNPTQILSFIKQHRLDRAINFNFSSDISNTKDFKIEEPRTLRSVLGADKNSLVSTFGGELEWDNFNVYLKASRGSDNGVSILYGKNLTKLEHNSDLSGVYTHLCPYAKVKDGDTEIYQQLTEKVLPIVTTLDEKKVLIKDFSSYFGTGEDDLPLTEANLRQVAQDYLLENILGIESPNVSLSFEELRNQLGYSNLHETVKLCDTVTVKYPDLGVNIKTQIVKTVYDSLKEKYKSLTLGAVKASLNDKINSIENELNDANEEIREVPSHIKVAVDHATEMITGAAGGCVVLNLDSQERPYELLIMNDYDKDDATKVWRWNINGLGYSPNGYNGPYTTAITADGHIVADFIDTGTLTADIIKAGTIEALTGDSYWNLETGDLNLTGEINATSGSFSHVTIDDSCTIYGNLWMEGEMTIGDRWGGAAYDYETRVGGDGIESSMDIGTYNPYGSPTYNLKAESYITPIGTIMVPRGRPDDQQYSDAWADMAFGIAADTSFLSSHMYCGLHTSMRYINGEGEYNLDQFSLSLTARDNLIYLSYDSRYPETGQYCYWGHSRCKNYFNADFYPGDSKYTDSSRISKLQVTEDDTTKYYGYMKGRWYFGERGWIENKEAPPNSPFICPTLCGMWWVQDSIKFGLVESSYHIYIDKDQITFSYGNNEVGDIEAYTNYVDIQGTWKTNGSNWISSSDIKIKNTIEELDDRYSVLFSNLQPRSYLFNEGKSGRKHTGFVVQEVLEAMNKAGISSDEYALCCAFGDPKDPETEWGLRYEEIIPLCVDAIQKLTKRVETLELQLKEEKK